MFPDSRFGLAMHVNGVAGLFETSGPDRFKSGALQSLFVGFRPLLVCNYHDTSLHPSV